MATFIQMAPLRTGSDHLGGWWYLRFSHSYRNVEELLSERGLPARHTTSGDRSTAMRPNWISAVAGNWSPLNAP